MTFGLLICCSQMILLFRIQESEVRTKVARNLHIPMKEGYVESTNQMINDGISNIHNR